MCQHGCKSFLALILRGQVFPLFTKAFLIVLPEHTKASRRGATGMVTLGLRTAKR